jgi:hypothetical protein
MARRLLPADRWLQNTTERDLMFAVRELLVAMGFDEVRVLQSAQETGRDIVFARAAPFGGQEWHAATVKVGRLSAAVSSPSSILRIIDQATIALDQPIVTPDGQRHPIDHLWVFTSLPLTAAALETLAGRLRERRVRFVDGETLRGLFTRHKIGILGRHIVEPAPPIVRVVPNITSQLLQFLREDPKRMRGLSPDVFEDLVGDRLEKMGYDVTLSKPTNRKDGGVDLIAVPTAAGAGTFLLAGQVKHHSGDQKVGVEDVDRLVALKNGEFRLGLLVTNTEFTADARWKAVKDDNKFFTRLRGFNDLKRWLENNFDDISEFRELPDRIELAPGIWIDVPRSITRTRRKKS